MIGWMFPGQGSQKPAMAAGLAYAGELFARAEPVIGANLEKLCASDEDPRWTPEVVQPALFVTSVAAAQTALDLEMAPAAAAGHSLGELAALVIAGSLEFEEGVRLVDVRGRAMAAAGRRNPGGMAAVIGLDPATIEQICADEGDVWVANLNSPKQTVVSGKDKPLAAVAESCLKAGAQRVIRLQVPVPSHCPLMEEARTEFEAELGKIGLEEPAFPIYCGADGARHTESKEIAELVAAALTSPVRFVDVVSSMRSDGIDVFVECGPGKVLRGLIRQIDPRAGSAALGSDEEAEALKESLGSSSESSTLSQHIQRRKSMSSSKPALEVAP